MSVVKINAIEVPDGGGPELEARFAARAGAVESSPGFQSFQLLRPVDGESRYFVMTWWDDEESFQAWRDSQDFAKGHGGGGAVGGGGPTSAGAGSGAQPRPVSMTTSLLSFEVVEQIPARPA